MAQGPSPAREAVPRPRIQTLSDMIFGLALSIGAVTLLNQKPTDVLAVAYSVLSFGFSFLILATVWLRYSRIMSVLPAESSGTIVANMLLLFLVSVEPYLFNLMTASSYAPPSGQLDLGATTVLYALDLGALQVILGYFLHELTVEERRLIPKELVRSYTLSMYTTFASAAVFLLSTLPVFWSVLVIQSPTVPLRFVMWNVVWVLNTARRVDVRATASRRSEP